MPASVNESSLVRTSVGNKFRITGTLSFTTYQTGGPVILANALDLDQIEFFYLYGAGGLVFFPIIATSGAQVNLKGFSAGGGGVFTGNPLPVHFHTLNTANEEVVAVMANTGTTTFIPGLIQAVFVTAGGVTGPFLMIPHGSVPASGQVAVNMTTGVLTFAGADAVTSATVTYLTTLTSSVSAGTPSGTIAGGAGGGEIVNGTNLAGLGNIPFECTGI